MPRLLEIMDDFPSACRKLMKSQKKVLLDVGKNFSLAGQQTRWAVLGKLLLALLIFVLPFGGLLLLIFFKVLPSLMFSAPEQEIAVSPQIQGEPFPDVLPEA